MLEIKPMIENSSMAKEYRGLPKYPAVLRDIALVVKDEIPVKDIEEAVRKSAENSLKK